MEILTIRVACDTKFTRLNSTPLPIVGIFKKLLSNQELIGSRSHPLKKVQPLTLNALAEYPIVTYHEGLTGRTKIDRSFSDASLTPNIVMSALDADVIKTYVELGMGIGIIASMAFNPARPKPAQL